jgi:predicted acyltransferase (DUF342 family)
MKKYELVDADANKHIRIRALRSFADVKKGQMGGYVSGEHNLSHEGDCWIDSSSTVCGNARVEGDARVEGSVQIKGSEQISYGSTIRGNAIIRDNARILSSDIYGDVILDGNVKVERSDIKINKENVYIGSNAKLIYCDIYDSSVHVNGDVELHEVIVSNSKNIILDGSITCNYLYIIKGEDVTIRGHKIYVGKRVRIGEWNITTSNITIEGNNLNIGSDGTDYLYIPSNTQIKLDDHKLVKSGRYLVTS